MSVNKMSFDKMSVNKLSVEKMSVEKMSIKKMSVDKLSVKKMSVEKMSVEKMSVDMMLVMQDHRNLSTRTSMFALVQQTFLAKNLEKNLLISTLDMVIYLIGTFFQGSKNLPLQYKIGWRSAEKNALFQHAASIVAPTISMRRTRS
jgi:hypothetical protein